eukprot:CAMPEP_0206281522 /NCGR_PEP_ID=MMETSP0047_2-20121206/39172_1 /ASSEMBLY_ACC=CAM_ASM_000192 /TAXON_ID=195065 /ORGANISM="Chroomonas mesostigmatica_cf, Strain CCMP1168" /LENGTH=231 /DNA_ID=CAMNT_0053711687 /DNA_START=1 /DNA_END=693 /DNA_ORIENTATION=+
MTAQTQLMEALQEDGAGVELLHNDVQVFDDMGKGIFSKKAFHIDRRFPPWLRTIAPKSGCTLFEESKNCFPVTSTSVTLPLFAKFKMRIDSVHYADRGETPNIHKLPEDVLKKRKVVYIDIAEVTEAEKKKKMYASDTSDPRTFKSTTTGRGPLHQGWQQESKPVMCAYKLVYTEFDYWGLQGKIEDFMQTYEQGLFQAANRQLFCWIDDWYGLSLTDVRDFEREVAERVC